MKTNQPTAEQLIKILDQAAQGDQTIAAVCREHGIAENTFYRWRKAYGGMTCMTFSHRGSQALLVIDSWPVHASPSGVSLDRVQHTEPQQIKVRSSVHHSFQQLHACHLPFGLTLTPGLGEGRADGRLVWMQAERKAPQFPQATRFCLGQPWIECRHIPFPHQAA